MLDFKTGSTIATSIVHSKLDFCTFLEIFLNIDSTQIQRLQLIQNSLERAVTRMPRHHHITPVLKSLHWLESPVPNLQLPPVLPAHLPSRSFHHSANPLYPIILLSHPLSTPVTYLRSPKEPYPSLHHVSGMTCHLNSAPFLYLHHHHSKL